MNEAKRAALRLNMVPGVGPRIFARLLETFGTAEQVFGATGTDLQTIPGVGAALAKAILTAPQQIAIDEEIESCERNDIRLLMIGEPDYPAELARIHDPPSVLYCKGSLLPTDRLAVAMVGSRHVTDYGIKVANQFGRGLAQAGFCVVSGMARGADAASHRAALAGGGRTIAVLGSGLLNIYPPEHTELAKEISQHGAVLSELPLHRPPHAGAFPQRNRIVSGLSLGVLVIEASSRSGALITARLAMEQNREVFAIPGRIDSRGSHGCHDLIRDGATLVQSVEDILDTLGPLAEPVVANPSTVSPALRGELARSPLANSLEAAGLTPTLSTGQPAAALTSIRQPAELLLNPQETLVLQAIGVEPTYVDQIVAATDLPINRVLATISVLQARRLIRRVSGTQVARI
ncbi:MAG: DNA-protecting protein DprA [Planctomycetaceae bacterium]|nr:DNA-protecting protein DprA [Planctomycetaceae bacterium]